MQDQLIFGVGRLLCALPLANVLETVRPLPVQPLAEAGGGLLGVAVIRGRAVPVIDTARLLGDPGAVPRRFVTVETPNGTIAFATGAVHGVRAAQRSAATTPGADAAPGGMLIEAVGVLDGQPLLFLNPTGNLAGNTAWITAGITAGITSGNTPGNTSGNTAGATVSGGHRVAA
jgi:purine-binding chemotaxis protein CheW